MKKSIMSADEDPEMYLEEEAQMQSEQDFFLASFTFGSNQECMTKCNITKVEWCQNIEVGISGLQCFEDRCISRICEIARQCEEQFEEPAEGYCPTVFDGWSCINSTMAGEVAVISCPPFEDYNFHPENYAYRTCAQNASWWDFEEQKPYTNYTRCPDSSKFASYDSVIKIYITGYTISIIFLLVATGIFFFFRRALRCVRNEIHTHLFVASILHNLSWLAWYGAVIYRMDTVWGWTVGEKVACKVLHVLMHYFMVSTYMWMLCEGLYLFIVLIVTFVSEKRVKLGLYAIGWLLPLAIIAVYVICRAGLGSPEKSLRPCWMDDLHFNWLYKAPCILSVFVNLFFLGWIVHVLVSKFHSDISDHAAMVKTAKAIAVLVPLFGLHNFLAAFKPEEDGQAKFVIEAISAVAISFQGAVVATLFCLINNEVIMEVKKFFGHQALNGPQSMAMTQYTYVRGGANGGHSSNQSSPSKPQAGDKDHNQQPTSSATASATLV